MRINLKVSFAQKDAAKEPGPGNVVLTVPKDIQLLCGCQVLPWEHCERPLIK